MRLTDQGRQKLVSRAYRLAYLTDPMLDALCREAERMADVAEHCWMPAEVELPEFMLRKPGHGPIRIALRREWFTDG